MVSAEQDLEICAEAASAETGLQLARSARPDLAIVDLSLAEGTGLELIRTLREAVPNVLVLILSMHDEALFAERVLRAGARGYITKQAAIDGLIGAIRHVLSGGISVSEGLAQSVLGRIGHRGTAPNGPLDRLTDRELEVFDLIGRGLSTAGIAEQIGVSVRTVDTYRSKIKAKLNLTDAADLIRFAVTWTERL
jgi:DNA-binding NarL/FixJ family response regulator